MTSDDNNIDNVLSAILNAEGDFDFEMIIPMPPILKKVSSGRRKNNGKTVSSYVREDEVERELTAAEALEIERIGYPSWYEWSIVHWGTKWNARRTSVDDLRAHWEGVEIRFDTAWTSPILVLLKLREMYPEVDFEFRCRFEDDPEFPHEITEKNVVDHFRLMKMLQLS